jgi:hypothetical protein
MVDLELLLRDKREDEDLSAEELEKVRSSAFKKWSDPILDALGEKRIGAVTALALITFPEVFEVFDGRKKEGEINFDGDGFPVAVKEFGLAGGLSLSVSWRDIVVQIPRGCVAIVVLCCK